MDCISFLNGQLKQKLKNGDETCNITKKSKIKHFHLKSGYWNIW